MLKEYFNNFKESIKNIREHNKEYFNKHIMRLGLVLILIFLSVAFVSNGFRFQFMYVECQGDNICKNPLFICDGKIDVYDYTSDCHSKPMSEAHQEIFDQGGCGKYLNAGQSFGHEPNWFVNKSQLIVLIILLTCFGINDIVHRIKMVKRNE